MTAELRELTLTFRCLMWATMETSLPSHEQLACLDSATHLTRIVKDSRSSFDIPFLFLSAAALLKDMPALAPFPLLSQTSLRNNLLTIRAAAISNERQNRPKTPLPRGDRYRRTTCSDGALADGESPVMKVGGLPLSSPALAASEVPRIHHGGVAFSVPLRLRRSGSPCNPRKPKSLLLTRPVDYPNHVVLPLHVYTNANTVSTCPIPRFSCGLLLAFPISSKKDG